LSAEKRAKMREELQREINDLNVRLRLLEERAKR